MTSMEAVALLLSLKDLLEKVNGCFMAFEQSNGMRSTYYTCKDLLKEEQVQQYFDDPKNFDHRPELSAFYSHEVEPADIFKIQGIPDVKDPAAGMVNEMITGSIKECVTIAKTGKQQHGNN